MLSFLIFCTVVYPQNSIRVEIKDRTSGAGVVDVNITQQHGKLNLGSSNRDGIAVLTLSGKDSVVFSKVGYQRLALPFSSFGGAFLVIKLERLANQLEEVVVNTGYQMIPKERSTGSFSMVSEKLLSEQTGLNVIDRLPYVVGSMTSDKRSTSPSLSIRGLSTIQGDKAPLIILDNFPYEGVPENLDPANVASITILKDAAAASIWGAKAGNGVIVITTKKGKLNSPQQIAASLTYMLTAKPDLQKMHQISARENLDLEKWLYEKGYYDSNFSDIPTAVTPFVELLHKAQNDPTGMELLNRYEQFYAQKDVRKEYQDHFYKLGMLQQYRIALSEGNDRSASRVGLAYDNDIAQVGASLKRLNFDVNNRWQINTRMALEVAAKYTNIATKNGRPSYGSITAAGRALPSYFSFTDIDGNAAALSKTYDQSYLAGIYPDRLLEWSYMPLVDYRNSNNTTARQQLLLDARFDVDMYKGIRASLQYRYSKEPYKTELMNGSEAFYTRNLINLYTQINGIALTRNIPLGAIQNVQQQDFRGHNGRMQLSYDLTKNKHGLNLLAGMDITDNMRYSTENLRYGYDPDLLTFKEVNYLMPFKNLVTGAMDLIPNQNTVGGIQNRYLSFFFNGAYSFDNRITVTLSGRKDGSNLFGVKTNDKFNPLGSVGLAYTVIGQGNGQRSAIDYLKLRTTYGISGNVDQTRSAVPIIAYMSVNNYTNTTYARVQSFANPHLRWEKIKMWNFALDLGAFKNRLQMTVEYFRKNAYDLFGFAEVDYTTGVGTSMVKNVAAMKGQGMDIEINGLIIDRAVKWRGSLNLSWFKDQVTDYYLSSNYGYNFVGDESPNISGITGKPVYSVYSYAWRGLDDKGNPVGLLNGQNATDYGQIMGIETTADELVYHGAALPTVYGNMRHQISYKGIELSALVQFNLGFYYRKNALSYNALINAGAGHEEYSKRWQKPGDEEWTTVPSLQYPVNTTRDAFYRAAEVNVVKGDFVRLQYIGLNYNLQKLRIRGINNARIGVQAQNLGILWRANKDKIDTSVKDGSIIAPKNYTLVLSVNF